MDSLNIFAVAASAAAPSPYKLFRVAILKESLYFVEISSLPIATEDAPAAYTSLPMAVACLAANVLLPMAVPCPPKARALLPTIVNLLSESVLLRPNPVALLPIITESTALRFKRP